MSKKLNFGPMDEKCFISRSELLQWINNLLLVSLTKVEQLGSGNIYCQLFDVIYPGKIPLNKLKWKAKHEYEFNHNFKLLQKGFDSVQVAKAIPIEKLVKVKYQDNLEFAQWMKRFFELNCKDKGKGYDAKKRRGFQEPDLSFCGGGVLPQYTMIYGNFKDMEREIVKKSEEEEDELENQINNSNTENSHGNKNNIDKENINNTNVQKGGPLGKQEPQLQKKINSDSKKSLLHNSSKSSNDYQQQQQQLSQSKVSVFNSTIAPMLMKPQTFNGQDRIFQSIDIHTDSNNNSECPFFTNNNQTNKYPTLNFQNNENNMSLLKQLDSNNNETNKNHNNSHHQHNHHNHHNNDQISKHQTPSSSDKIYKYSDDIMNSGSSNSLTEFKIKGSSDIKLEQIKQIFLNSQIDAHSHKDTLINLLNSIKTIIE